jgi:hypothetical protein
MSHTVIGLEWRNHSDRGNLYRISSLPPNDLKCHKHVSNLFLNHKELFHSAPRCKPTSASPLSTIILIPFSVSLPSLGHLILPQSSCGFMPCHSKSALPIHTSFPCSSGYSELLHIAWLRLCIACLYLYLSSPSQVVDHQDHRRIYIHNLRLAPKHGSLHCCTLCSSKIKHVCYAYRSQYVGYWECGHK